MTDTSTENGSGRIVGLGQPAVHQWLQDALYDKRITQRAVADAWGITEGGVSRLINHGGSVPVDRIEILAEKLGMPADDVAQKFREAGTSVRITNGHADPDAYSDPQDALVAAIARIPAKDREEAIKAALEAVSDLERREELLDGIATLQTDVLEAIFSQHAKEISAALSR